MARTTEMIHVNTFHPYNLRDLEAAIHGVHEEIHRRQISLANMNQFLAGTAPKTMKFRRSTIAPKIAKAETEIKKLKVIKIELLYLHELSKLRMR